MNYIGILISDGSKWTINRRFALKVLRDFGLGKSSLTELIQFEVETLIEFLKTKINQPFIIDTSLNVAIVNTLMQITIGI